MLKPTLVIMAGGTGGHVFPGLAVAKYMLTLGWEVQWIGTEEKMEADIVPKNGIDIHFIKIAGIRGKSIFTKFMAPIRLLSAFNQARTILSTIKPSVALGMGGYASGPGGLACKALGIPLIVHEQNAVFGLTNRVLAKVSARTLTGFDLANVHSTASAPPNLTYVGNPIREGFFNIHPKTLDDSGELKDNICILIIGGSLGALALNQMLPEVLANLSMQVSEKVSITVRHQAGKGKHQAVLESYKSKAGNLQTQVEEFIDDMESAFEWADIIICRAGALTVAEVAGAGRAAIFVPLPIAVDDHQTANAKYLSEQNAALIIQQSNLREALPSALLDLCENHQRRIQMSANAKQLSQYGATEKLAKVIQETALLKTTSDKLLNTHLDQQNQQGKDRNDA